MPIKRKTFQTCRITAKTNLFDVATVSKQIKIYQMKIYINIWFYTLIFWFNAGVQAQKAIDFTQAVKIAIANNQKIRVANLELLKQKASINKAYDLENTQLNGEFGQFNSAYFDSGFGISQGFSLPQVYKHKKDMYGQQANTAEAYLKLSEFNINQRLDALFLEYNYLNAKVSLLKRQDNLFEKYLEKSLIRWKTGESDILEKTSAEQQRINLSKQLNLTSKLLNLVEIEFNWLLNDKMQQYLPLKDTFVVIPYYSIVDTNRLMKHPELILADREIQVAKAATLVEKDGLLPRFSAGYRNVSIRGLGPDEVVYSGSDRFSSFQLGVYFPIFRKAINAAVKSSQLQEEIQNQNYIGKRNEIVTTVAQKTLIYNELLGQLNDFQERSLPNAIMIRDISEKKYSAGEINYLDFVVLINQAINIENEYLELVKQINTLVIELKYLGVSN